MWKESYRIGVERIDFQHKALFEKTQELLEAIDRGAGPFVFQEIISFLKGYVVFHFRDEEKYQKSIGYKDYDAHKRAHEAFTALVLDYERRLTKADFALPLMKDLAGTLSAWLIYHVANTDLKMVQGLSTHGGRGALSNIQVFTTSVEETLQSIAGVPADAIKEYDAAAAQVPDGVQVSIGLFGDINGTLTYTYSREIAENLFAGMTAMRPREIDEMVCSAMAEITNISTGNATIMLAGGGRACDITPPKIQMRTKAAPFEGVVLDTGMGRLKLSAQLDQY